MSNTETELSEDEQYEEAARLEQEAEERLHDRAKVEALFLAVHNRPSGSLEQVKMCIAQGADVNGRSARDNTPLHYAIRSDDSECAEVLLAAGADVNAQNYQGDTPLHEAARLNSEAMTSLLLTAGADDCLLNHAGHSSLAIALSHGRAKASRPLEEKERLRRESAPAAAP